MMGDIGLVIQWWGTLFLVGAAAYPLTKVLFASWWDRGWLFAKAVGMATTTFLVYLLGTLRVLSFSAGNIISALGMVFVAGTLLTLRGRGDKGNQGNQRGKFYTALLLFTEEAFFFLALLFWAWVKGHEPSIHGLEKFMDFGFTRSILNASYFPAPDMWYIGGTINYYYFGHVVMAVLTKLSGLDLRYTFNLMLVTLFALTLTMSFSIGYQLWQGGGERRNKENRGWSIAAGVLTAFLVTLGGNLQTIYAFTRGYAGDQVKPFWQLLWPLAEVWTKLPEGLNRYWYANATRFIPFTIHEFPSYSFVVSDVHGHVLSLPFVFLVIALLVTLFIIKPYQNIRENIVHYVFFGLLVGILLTTNVLDGPIYLGLFAIILGVQSSKFKIKDFNWWKEKGLRLGLVGLIALAASLPFLVHFQSFVHGLAVNCPPTLLTNTRIGPVMFEGVEKCQHSPVWMWLLLWGFFIFCGISLVFASFKQKGHPIPRALIVFFFFALALVIFPEFFYFKDIYPMHFRSNTMFKLGYQAFILFSIVSGYSIVRLLSREISIVKLSNYQIAVKKLFVILLVPQLFLVSIYPIFSVRSYFGGLKVYEGLDGLGWLVRQYPADYQGIQWLNGQISNSERSALVEADGDSYTDYGRFSAFTGIPTIIGWPVHEWLWRGSYDVVAPRRSAVEKIYESQDLPATQRLLSEFGVRYVVVGALEREKYKNLKEGKFATLGHIVFRSGSTVIYEIP